MQWIKLTDRMPNPDEHGRVLIFTEGYDFNGEQVFDVKAETLNECFYADPLLMAENADDLRCAGHRPRISHAGRRR